MLTKSISTIIPIVLLTCLACTPHGPATNDSCKSVPFDLVNDMVGRSGRGTAMVGIQPEDLSTAKLACVATRLSQTHPWWGDVNVEIFDSVEAAKHHIFNHFGDGGPPDPKRNQMEYEDRWRATYKIDAATDQEYLVIPTISCRPEKYKSRIDLPLTGKPRCRFEVADRCLISAGSPDYPETEQGSIEGTVKLEVEVTPRGTIGNVRIAQASSSTAEGRELLARAAVANVKTWRLDPASREDTATIDYQFKFVDGPRKISSEEVVRSLEFGVVEVEMASGTNLTVKRFTSIDSN